MTYAASDLSTLPRLPGWVTSTRAETFEDVAFLSGVVLGHLHLVLAHPSLPQRLLRQRLALLAAEAAMRVAGRPERAGALRDAVAFLQPGHTPGPAGEVYLSWMRGVERPVSVGALHRALPDGDPEQFATWLDAGQGAPVAHAASVLQSVIEAQPRNARAALILADAALAQCVGWRYVVPLLALGLKRGDLGKSRGDLRLACLKAITAAVGAALREAGDLTQRAARLRDVAPKLRAKGANEAVALFLNRDAVAPTALTSLRSDRAARRFCDRLVELGAVRELTGRDTFRLYGL